MSENIPTTSITRTDWIHRTPTDLSVSPVKAARILVIGSCFSEAIVPHFGHAFPGAEIDYIPYNFAGELPQTPPHPLNEYAFQLVVLPMRTIASEHMTMRLQYQDHAGYLRVFDESQQRLLQLLDGALQYHTANKILTFVANFMLPQQNAMGRMLPRYDIRNPVHYVEKLNEVLASEISAKENAYLIDFDSISATIGRQYVQDDGLWMHAHGTCVSDWDNQYDQARLEIPQPYSARHEVKTDEFYAAVWHELRAMLTSATQTDSVKLVIIDLDDTLWRGIVAEEGIRYAALEGYPLGFIESLQFLKRRGILLAIASKNDEAKILEIWDSFVGGVLPMTDFASRKINWDPKVENIREILNETNLLPKNVVFIDDNPAERAAVREAFPDMRVLGDDIYRLRRVLLWSGETQTPRVTDESGRRTEMIQAQIQRESARTKMSREEFLASLGVSVTLDCITGTDHQKFARAFELVNKSNQFNTTGKRWTYEECDQGFKSGMVFYVAHVKDKYTDYGLVAVAISLGNLIEQYVMSCRVFGLGVEQAVIASIAQTVHAHADVHARVVETPANALGRDVFSKCDFVLSEDGTWVLPRGAVLAVPTHVALSLPQTGRAPEAV
ncbi:HAD-IIIC family phosphatase [Burkholderia plantarii]|uniref:HAD-IIIC family phosphatase n=1 Tax=Burkholderia plantarii TaxID=41899 RepID=UPI0018DC2B33|nr:HAD-IIIC family phosphatase [Burkholderia plantarii]MBI0329643.1 HAD-IIIC family phosphatase [Burkholderia plantarii]